MDTYNPKIVFKPYAASLTFEQIPVISGDDSLDMVLPQVIHAAWWLSLVFHIEPGERAA